MNAGTPTDIDTVRGFPDLRALVIGDAMLDVFVEGTASRLCREAPVPVVDKRSEWHRPGGAANSAANLAALGAQTFLAGLVGDDQPGRDLRSALRTANVNVDALISDSRLATLRKTRVLANDQYLLRVDDGDVSTHPDATRNALIASIEELFPRCDLVVVPDYGRGTISDELIARLRQLRRHEPRPLVVDARDLLRYADAGATLVTPNFDEAKAASQTASDDPDEIADRLRQRIDAESIAITLAEGGCLLVDGAGNHTRLPAHRIEQVDDVGAGDSFTAATALALAISGDPVHAARIGIEAASIRCSRRDSAIITRQELLRRVSLSESAPAASPSLREIAVQLDAGRHAGHTVVFTNGVFDILHAGHVQLLRRAKALGNILVVGVNSDASVRRLKGPQRPINREGDRLALVAALDAVDHAVIFGEDTPAEVIRALRPDIHVKGGDYTADTLPEIDAVREVGARVEILPLRDGLSTTNVIEQILSRNVRDTAGHIGCSPPGTGSSVAEADQDRDGAHGHGTQTCLRRLPSGVSRDGK